MSIDHDIRLDRIEQQMPKQKILPNEQQSLIDLCNSVRKICIGNKSYFFKWVAVGCWKQLTDEEMHRLKAENLL
jgi:hypothetical protein